MLFHFYPFLLAPLSLSLGVSFVFIFLGVLELMVQTKPLAATDGVNLSSLSLTLQILLCKWFLLVWAKAVAGWVLHVGTKKLCFMYGWKIAPGKT